jgi:prepilin-type N-terminal cleavage/methylation domain-containing protein
LPLSTATDAMQRPEVSSRRSDCQRLQQGSNIHNASGGFTLAEMLVAIAVLALVVVFVSRLVDSAAAITTLGHKHMDTDSQARQLLDRMAIDFAQMVKRSDVSYYVKNQTNSQIGNDQLAFFSALPGYYPSSLGYNSNISLIAYRVNSNSNMVERMGKGLALNGAYATPSPSPSYPILFLDSTTSPTTTILLKWPVATSSTASDPDYELAAPQVFRFEYYYLLRSINGTPILDANGKATTALSGGPWANANSFAIKDVAAIAVDIAAIDAKSKVLLTDAQITALVGLLGSYAAGMGPGQLLGAWQTSLDGVTNMPRPAISGIRLYERYFYLNQ